MGDYSSIRFFKKISLLVLFTLTSVIETAELSSSRGSIQLDEYTFDKLISKFDATLVKFDVAFPYGDKHEAYGVLAKDAVAIDNLLIAEVGIKDYGERDNEEISKRFDVKKDDYPVVKLFLKGKDKPITFSDKNGFTANNLRVFLKENSGIHISLPGCIQSLDTIALQFLSANDEKKKILLEEVNRLIEGFKENDTKTGKIYELMMKKIIEKGANFVETEKNRVKKLLTGKMSQDKKAELTHRINILLSFSPEDAKAKENDEL